MTMVGCRTLDSVGGSAGQDLAAERFDALD